MIAERKGISRRKKPVA